MTTKKEKEEFAELLARIDERTSEIKAKLEHVTTLMDSTIIKVNEHDIVLYGRGGREGLVRKVERHDKAFWKAVGIGGFLMLALEFLKGWIK